MPGSLQTQHLGLSLISIPADGGISHIIVNASPPCHLACAQWGLPEAGKW